MQPEQQTLLEVERTYEVSELNARVTEALRRGFPEEIWVRGEVQGLSTSNAGHLYFSLHEKDRGRAPATLSVALFAGEWRRIREELADVPDFALSEGIDVRLRGRVTYYAPNGKLQLVVSGLDPLHTLGRLAARRQRVLKALAADGLLDANRRIPVPIVPMHVGLVSSDGSAGCTDFLHELETSGLAWRVTVADARVQGTDAERSVVRALSVLAARRPDVVCVVRGGGARTDLAAFDSERIARTIAAMPVPVLTGIGHEVDTSVADQVAHTTYKTPTACAAALVEMARSFLVRVDEAWASVQRGAVATFDDRGRRVDHAARAVAGSTRSCLRAEEQASTSATERIRRAGTSAAVRAGAVLERHAGRAEAAARLRVGTHGRRLDDAAARLRSPRLGADLSRHTQRLDAGARRLRVVGLSPLRVAGNRTELAAARVAAADPARALERGFSITRRPDGRLVRRAAEVTVGDVLITSFADGTARQQVEEVAMSPAHDVPGRQGANGDH